MKTTKKQLFGLNRFEIILWTISAFVICFSFLISRSSDFVSLIGSIIGITSLIFLAKGYVAGQVLIIVFSVFYGIVSFYNNYYGEMITYLCMTAPMAVVALIEWIRHPYKDTKEVAVSKISKHHLCLIPVSSILVTAVFYSESTWKRFPYYQHTIYYHKFYCGVSYRYQKSILCFGLRLQRYSTYCFVDSCFCKQH